MINEGEIEIPSSAELKELVSKATMQGLKEHYKALISTAPIKTAFVISLGIKNNNFDIISGSLYAIAISANIPEKIM